MALTFDGTDDYLTKAVALFSGYPLTLVAWLRPEDRGAAAAVASDSGSGTSARVQIGATSGGKFALNHRGSTVASSVHYSNSNTTWFHVGGVFPDKDNLAIYVNGSADGTGTSGSNVTFADSDNFYIGARTQSSPTSFWEGGIAEVAAYNVSLTVSEMASLAAGFSPLLVRPSALVGYWPLGGSHFPTNIDPVASNTLTLTNFGSPPATESHPRTIHPSYPIIIAAAGGQAARAMHHYRMLRCS